MNSASKLVESITYLFFCSAVDKGLNEVNGSDRCLTSRSDWFVLSFCVPRPLFLSSSSSFRQEVTNRFTSSMIVCFWSIETNSIFHSTMLDWYLQFQLNFEYSLVDSISFTRTTTRRDQWDALMRTNEQVFCSEVSRTNMCILVSEDKWYAKNQHTRLSARRWLSWLLVSIIRHSGLFSRAGEMHEEISRPNAFLNLSFSLASSTDTPGISLSTPVNLLICQSIKN